MDETIKMNETINKVLPTKEEIAEQLKEVFKHSESIKRPVFTYTMDPNTLCYPGGQGVHVFLKLKECEEEVLPNIDSLYLTTDYRHNETHGKLVYLNKDGKVHPLFTTDNVQYIKVRVFADNGLAFTYLLTNLVFLTDNFEATINTIVLQNTLTFTCCMEIVDG